MWLIIRLLPDISLELIVHSAGLAGVPWGRLKGHGGRAVRGQLEKEWKCICSQLFQQSLLQIAISPCNLINMLNSPN